MNEAIEKLGSVISSQVDKHPKRAAAMLGTAYRAVGLHAKHFPGKQYTRSREYLQAYTALLLADMLKDPSKSAVVNIFMPSEIFCALGMPIMAPEALATYVVNTASERVFIDKAEENGAGETFCSIHKVLTGMAEAGVIKAPAMVANTTLACDANQLTFRRLADSWQVPHALIDVPWRADVIDEDVRFADGLMYPSDRPGLGIELDETAAAAHPRQDHWLRHYVGTLTNIRPPDSVKYYS